MILLVLEVSAALSAQLENWKALHASVKKDLSWPLSLLVLRFPKAPSHT
jgi:hypothetical protein